MVAARRLRWNFALQHAVNLALETERPLIVLEALRCDYPWASDRLHRFVLDGMNSNQRAAANSRALYYPYVEPKRGRGRGLIRALGREAAAIVTDWFPAFFLPRMLRAAGQTVGARLDAVDSNGLIPLAAHGKSFTSARSFRAFAHRELPGHLAHVPEEQPLARLRALPRPRMMTAVARRWPSTSAAQLDPRAPLTWLPIDHDVPAVATRGGSDAATSVLRKFLDAGLPRYAEDHRHPDADCTSRLSPYLHFGHISVHQVFAELMTRERWTTRRLANRRGGMREGWWGVSASAEAFLDELVIWRELAYNGCEWTPQFARYSTLPDWAKDTLAAHASDRRRRYSFAVLDAAQTHDEVWNAAQRQLKTEGWFHGYLRMLWGKKILEWSPSPEAALDRMIRLMDRYSLDGRDPNSYAGYTWVLGRYDRPWPERPIFGTVRTMTSESAKRKLRMKEYLAHYNTPNF
jgi:deoxyribodipyrimidine photo-lyase